MKNIFLKKYNNTAAILLTISLLFQFACCEAAMQQNGGAGVLSNSVESSVDRNGLTIKTMQLYSKDLSEKYYRNDFTQTGVIPISIKVVNNSQVAQILKFNKSSFSSEGVSNSQYMTVRAVMERTKEGGDIGIFMNLVLFGVIGAAVGANYSSDIKSIKFDEVEEAIVNDKVDPVVTINPGESINGVMFFNALVDAGDGKVVPLKQISNGKVQLVVNSSADNNQQEETIIINI